MNKQVRKAINEAFKRLMAMPKKEFRKELSKHKNGDIAIMLRELDEFSKSEHYRKAFENVENKNKKRKRTSRS